jgi:hypothetical protein
LALISGAYPALKKILLFQGNIATNRLTASHTGNIFGLVTKKKTEVIEGH